MFVGNLSEKSLIETLRDSGLLRDQCYIGGQWRKAATHDVVDVYNPSDATHIGSVPDLSVAQATEAVDAADTAFPAWAHALPKERAQKLRQWGVLMLAERQDLALIMTLEQGKPLHESLGEIDYAASFLDWYAGEAERLNVEGITPHLEGCDMRVSRVPVGVSALITPWNFPSAMITRKAGAALAVGCTVVVKPAPETPFSALALAVLAERAGIPAGVFNVITGDAPLLAKTLCDDLRVRALSFTGSTRIGKQLLQWSAPTLKRVSLELGGHAPFIVFDDVDIERAVTDAVAAKFQTSGQDCLAANRIYIHDAIYADFCQRFAAATKHLKVGDGLSRDTDIGPLMHQGATDKCLQHVDDARAKGARILAGGGRHSLGGLFFEPTVIADVTPDMAISSEETFGPVAALSRFSSEDQVIGLANATQYGLAAYLYTGDGTRATRLASRLEFGMVAVNRIKMTGAPIPFGGMKQSGLGREGSRHGIDAFSDIQYICTAT